MIEKMTLQDAQKIIKRNGIPNPVTAVDDWIDFAFDVAEAILRLEASRDAAFDAAAKKVDEWVTQYPKDLWPDKMVDDETGEIKPNTHPDAMAAKTLRRILPVIAKTIRNLAGKPASAEQGNGDLIAKAVADEREACARIAEAPFTGQPHTELSRGKMEAANTIAKNIRARNAVAGALSEDEKR